MSSNRQFRAPEGTKDILPERIPLWLKMEETIRRVCSQYGYEEIRTPIFESTRLFHKTTGATTDIVEKEMFTFGSEPDTFSLRPELTPSIVRVLIEHNLHKKKGFWKFFYIGPAFRHERPQAGRQRQFHQFGIEAIGSVSPLLDVESMLLYNAFLKELGIFDATLKINSIGCPDCRGTYREVLRDAIRPNVAQYCKNCQKRFDRNVFRILDCKVPSCGALVENLPKAIDHVCDRCREHFSQVEEGLKQANVSYEVDPRIVRGLDYYTRTVYEFQSGKLGAQNSLCGGGRYDTLVKDMDGPELGAVGFASGLERVLMVMEALGVRVASAPVDFYVVSVGEETRVDAFGLVQELRGAGLRGDLDYEGRSLKAQMRTANKSGARFALLLGKKELDMGRVKVKDMHSGEEQEIDRPQVVAHLNKGGES